MKWSCCEVCDRNPHCGVDCGSCIVGADGHWRDMTEDEIDAKWLGIMLEYTEQDFPESDMYKRLIPGWQCRGCTTQVGTSGPPPHTCPGCNL